MCVGGGEGVPWFRQPYLDATRPSPSQQLATCPDCRDWGIPVVRRRLRIARRIYDRYDAIRNKEVLNLQVFLVLPLHLCTTMCFAFFKLLIHGELLFEFLTEQFSISDC